MTSKIILQCGQAILFIMLLVKCSLSLPISRPTRSNADNEDVTVMDGCRCVRKTTTTCTSLEEALYNLYSTLDSDADTPYHFFTLRDLFYSEILDGKDSERLQAPPLSASGTYFNSEGQSELRENRCADLLERVKLPRKDTDECTWSYNCTQNQLMFPSFSVEAVITNSNNYDNGICSKVTTENRRFLRTQCTSDPTLPHWIECECNNIVVGYKSNI